MINCVSIPVLSVHRSRRCRLMLDVPSFMYCYSSGEYDGRRRTVTVPFASVYISLLMIIRLTRRNQSTQVAQLSQRDHAAGWGSYGENGRLELGDNILWTL